MSRPIDRAKLVKECNILLSKMFATEYERYLRPQYKMKWVHGKYTIYKIEWMDGNPRSTTLAHSLDKETATGMMKLLENPNE